MAQFVLVPFQRLKMEVLQALLEDYATRDGTDYGERELTTQDKVDRLRCHRHRLNCCSTADIIQACR